MEIINSVKKMQDAATWHRKQGQSIAVVPTMGFLHEGHLSLVRDAKNRADIVIITLFVNPIQFGPNEDYGAYPRDEVRDARLAEENGADYMFIPDVREMYPIGYSTKVNVGKVSDKFEGAFRPGHFEGVATVVAKLFNCTLPDFALFGLKDYQQSLVIKRMAADMNFPVEIITRTTIREADGLAMSSRNKYLSPDVRSKAGILFVALEKAKLAIAEGERERKKINAILHKTLRSVPEIKLDYGSSALADTLEEPEIFLKGDKIVLLIAAYLGKTRLIDNSLVQIP